MAKKAKKPKPVKKNKAVRKKHRHGKRFLGSM